MERVCVRPGCRLPAIALARMDMDAARVRLLPPSENPLAVDLSLCEVHMSRFSVPRGWELSDERRVPPSAEAADPAPPALDEEPPLLQATSPLLARAFRASGPQRSVLTSATESGDHRPDG